MAVNEIRYKGVSYATDDNIKVPSGVLYEAKALRSDSLEANSLTVTVYSSDKAIMGFAKHDKVEYFRNGHRVGVYYLQTVERVGSDAYTLSALSALGRLITMRHAGGIYTGQTVAEVVSQICGPVPVIIESVYASRKLYGYLPYSSPDTKTGNGQSARDNLSQVLFAIGAALGTDEDGVMRVEKLWDGVSCAITADQINEDSCSTVYETPVSAVEVTEHQWVQNQDETTLFEGTAEDGTLVTFDEPAHDLTAEGFAVTEQGDNYAVLSAGSGTLTGKGYTHLTRIVRRTVTEGAEENVVAITDATLVSLTNSVDVANRMADYYSHRETIQVDVEPGAEHAGSVVRIYHPWDKEMVQACVESRETVISGILNSQTRALVGFTPQQPEAAEYYDERVLLTGSGTWTPPENTETITAVLIGGGDGGGCGQDGHKPTKTAPIGNQYIINSGGPCYFTRGFFQYQHNIWDDDPDPYAGQEYPGGDGGDPGEGRGLGGKVFRVTFTPQAGQEIAYACGVGGVGGLKSEEAQAGASGTPTTFGDYSSDNGSHSDVGFTDPLTGDVFAQLGAPGQKGGNGGGLKISEDGKDAIFIAPGEVTVGDVVYTGGAVGSGSYADVGDSSSDDSNGGAKERSSAGGRGGGAAYGGNGGNGGDGTGRIYTSAVTVTPGPGGAGADATAPPKEQAYGKGGTSGNGGGGGGIPGYVGTWAENRTSKYYTAPVSTLTVNQGVPGNGGQGSDGGEGGDGCIIVYYRRRKAINPGPLVTSDGKWLLDSLGRRVIV